MTNDTVKSLGYLKKSLGMTKRAVNKNAAADGSTKNEVDSISIHIDSLIGEISVWEARAKATAPSSQAAPAGVTQPAPAAPVMSIINPDPDGDDILVNMTPP